LRAKTTRPDSVNSLKLVFILMNAFIYVLEIGFTLVTMFLDDGSGEKRNRSIILYLVFMSVKLTCMCGAFLYYGHRIYSQLVKFSQLSIEGTKAVRIIKTLTITTVLCFISGVIFIGFYIGYLRLESSFYLISDILFNIFIWFSSILIFALTRKPKRIKKKSRDGFLLEKDSDTASMGS